MRNNVKIKKSFDIVAEIEKERVGRERKRAKGEAKKCETIEFTL